MKYDRNVIIDKINELKGKRGTKQYMSNEKIAQYLDVSDKTVKKWLKKKPECIGDDEAGYPDIPFPYIVKLCDLFGCDIEHLIDKDMTCKTKEATDISKATGLSEEAINILKQSNRINDRFIIIDEPTGHQSMFLANMKKSLDECFIKVINNVIESYCLMDDDGHNKETRFPINDIVAFAHSVQEYNEYIREDIYRTIQQINDEEIDMMKGLGFLFEEDELIYKERLKELLEYESTDIKGVTLNYEVERYLKYEQFRLKDKRYKSIDILMALSRFLTSDFIENMGVKGNGK